MLCCTLIIIQHTYIHAYMHACIHTYSRVEKQHLKLCEPSLLNSFKADALVADRKSGTYTAGTTLLSPSLPHIHPAVRSTNTSAEKAVFEGSTVSKNGFFGPVLKNGLFCTMSKFDFLVILLLPMVLEPTLSESISLLLLHTYHYIHTNIHTYKHNFSEENLL